MKDHGATGVTGCLKNIAYGSFSNVARTHQSGKSHTYSMVGTLASVEPLRSRTVLQIMDGLRAVWHGGPFARTTRYVFYPRQIMFGTDPVAIDRLLLDIIDDKRKRRRGDLGLGSFTGVAARWTTRARATPIPTSTSSSASRATSSLPSTLGLGVYDREQDHGPGRRRMTLLAAASARGIALRLLDAGHRYARDAGVRWHQARLCSAGARRRLAQRRLHGHAGDAGRVRRTRSAAGSWRDRRAPALRLRRAARGSSPTAGVFVRTPAGKFKYDVPAGKGVLAAAEAFAYGADVILEDRSGRSGQRSARLLTFLEALSRRLRAKPPPMSAVVDDGSDVTGEVMNLLTRRNLPVPGRSFSVIAITASTSPSARPSIHRRMPPTRARSR